MDYSRTLNLLLEMEIKKTTPIVYISSCWIYILVNSIWYMTHRYIVISYCSVRYCTVLYCTVLYCTVLYCTILYRTVVHWTVLYCTILYYAILYCTVLYWNVLYPEILLLSVSWYSGELALGSGDTIYCVILGVIVFKNIGPLTPTIHGDKSGLCNWILCLSVLCLFTVLCIFSNLTAV